MTLSQLKGDSGYMRGCKDASPCT